MKTLIALCISGILFLAPNVTNAQSQVSLGVNFGGQLSNISDYYFDTDNLESAKFGVSLFIVKNKIVINTAIEKRNLGYSFNARLNTIGEVDMINDFKSELTYNNLFISNPILIGFKFGETFNFIPLIGFSNSILLEEGAHDSGINSYVFGIGSKVIFAYKIGNKIAISLDFDYNRSLTNAFKDSSRDEKHIFWASTIGVQYRLGQ